MNGAYVWRVAFVGVAGLLFLISMTSQISAQTVPPVATSTPTSLLPTVTPVLTATWDPQLIDKVRQIQDQIDEIQMKIDKPTKDIWDILSSLSGLISGGLIAGIGIWVTYLYNKRQQDSMDAHNKRELTVQQAQTVQSFMSHLTSDDEREVEAALLTITALGNAELAIRLSDLFKSKGSVSALYKIAKSSEMPAAEQARNSIARLTDASVDRMLRLMTKFKGQEVPSKLFYGDTDSTLVLPTFTSVFKPEHRDTDPWAVDIFADNSDEQWQVRVEISIDSVEDAISSLYVNQIQPEAWNPRHEFLWLVFMGERGDTTKKLLREKTRRYGIAVSLRDDIETLEYLSAQGRAAQHGRAADLG